MAMEAIRTTIMMRREFYGAILTVLILEVEYVDN